MTSNYELRRRARASLGDGIFQEEWLCALLVMFVYALLSSATAYEKMPAYYPIVLFILSGPISFGISKYFLALSRRTARGSNFGVLFEDAAPNFLSNVLLGVVSSIFIALWSLLFVIPGIVKIYAYSMAYYVKCDNPDYSYMDCIEESQRLMRGHKLKLFFLDLSFIGWFIVGALCLGIGTLWVVPYANASHAEFYNELVGQSAQDTYDGYYQ